MRCRFLTSAVTVVLVTLAVLAGASDARARCMQDAEVLADSIDGSGGNPWLDLFVLPLLTDGSRLCGAGHEGAAGRLLDRAIRLFENMPSRDAMSERTSMWSTNFGPATLTVLGNTLAGTYSDYKGRFHGTIKGGEAKGIWYQQARSEKRCRDERFGTRNWGRFVFKGFGNGKFSGIWAYCEDNPRKWGVWTGNLITGPDPKPIPLGQ